MPQQPRPTFIYLRHNYAAANRNWSDTNVHQVDIKFRDGGSSERLPGDVDIKDGTMRDVRESERDLENTLTVE